MYKIQINSKNLCRSLFSIPSGLGHSTTFHENTSASGSCTVMLGTVSLVDLRGWQKQKKTENSNQCQVKGVGLLFNILFSFNHFIQE